MPWCHSTSFVCIVCVALFNFGVAAGDDLRIPIESDDALRRLYEQSERRISVLAANLFHDRFIEQCLKVLPDDLHLSYGGDLSLYSRPPKVRVEGSAKAHAIVWAVDDEHFGVFSFWLSTERMSLTEAKVTIEDQPLFINVDFVDGNKGVNAKLPQLGDRSVREVLKLLEDEPEKKTDRKDAGAKSPGAGKK